MDLQLGLFPDTAPAATPPTVGPAEPSVDVRGLAMELPRGLRLGTSSWSFPGWHEIVYDRPASEATLAREGLAAYAAHPLLRTVCVDRSYYRALTATQLRAYAGMVPEDFRFVMKADRLLTSPIDPRAIGMRSRNPHFLDERYATREVIGPWIEGLGEKAGPLLFQFPPFPLNLVGGRRAFLQRLHAFLLALPKGPEYAVELRTPAVLTEEYGALLEAVGAAHCYNVHPAMAPLEKQLELLQPFYQPVVLVRWMLHAGLGYEDARSRYEPFDRLVDEDPPTRDRVARAVLDGLLGERNAFVVANNKAEGSAPLTLLRLATRLAHWNTEEG